MVDFATAFAFENNRLTNDKFIFFVLGDGLVRKSTEVSRFAACAVAKLLHELYVVSFVIAVFSAVACAVNSRFTVQCKNFKTRVVCKYGRFDVLLGEPLCRCVRLDDGVFCKGISVFDNIFVKTDVFQSFEFVVVCAQNVCEVSNLSGTSRRDYK